MIHDAVGKEYGHQMVIDNTIAAAYILLRVENVTLVMIRRDEEGKLMTSDSFEPGIDRSRGVAGTRTQNPEPRTFAVKTDRKSVV